MDEIIESIRVAVTVDASPEARSTGIAACRTILTALEGTVGEPMTSAIAAPPSPIAAIVSSLRGVPPDQLLDLAIAKLRAALPDGTEVPRVEPLKIHIVQFPRKG